VLSSSLHTVRIDKIIAGGMGLARTEAGQVIMSGFVLPGELVLLRELKRKSGYIEAELVQVLEPSSERVHPRCPLYGECGGCDLQHASSSEQLRIKHAIVTEAMQRAHVPLPALGIAKVLPSPQQWGYRHRVRLQLSPSGQLGFCRRRSHELAVISSCPIATDEINTTLRQLHELGCLHGLAALSQELELHCSPLDRCITLLLKAQAELPAAIVQHLATCTSIDQIACTHQGTFRHLYSRSNPAKPLQQHFSLADHSWLLSWSAGCFSQVNPQQNMQLVRLLLNMAGPVQGQDVLDLYCGMGNLSLPLALSGGTVLGVEGSQESVRWAQSNARQAGLHPRFVTADVPAYLRQMVKAQQRAEIILLDPPRAGIGPAAALLPALRADQLLYVSCDPVTLARDLALLSSKGFSLTALTPLDMFPQTSHIEAAAGLSSR